MIIWTNLCVIDLCIYYAYVIVEDRMCKEDYMKLLKLITKHNLQYYLICLLVILACFNRRQTIIDENNITNTTISENTTEIIELVLHDFELSECDLPSLLSASVSKVPEPITIDLLLEKNEDLQEDISEFNEDKPLYNKALATNSELAFQPYDKPNLIINAMEEAKIDIIENYEKEQKAKEIRNYSNGNYNAKENGIGEYNGTVLNNRNGRIQGPSGQETWYNLDMSRVVQSMRNRGYDYEYWVRSDGVKMFGDYVMVAANLEIRPKGTLVPTSLGMGIVCDTGGFAKKNIYQLDIATSW